MSHQTSNSTAFVTKVSPEPEVKEEVKKEDDDFPRSLEEALLGE